MEPQGTETVRTAQAGVPQERTELEGLGPAEQPNYDVRQEELAEERRPAGPPLLEGLGGAVPAFDPENDEAPTDPAEPD